MNRPVIKGWLFVLLAAVTFVDAQILIDPSQENVDVRFRHQLKRLQQRAKRSDSVPTESCRNIGGCNCAAIDEDRFSCSCPNGKDCLLIRQAPVLYIEPDEPYRVEPGGDINITCAAVAYPFPEIYWKREGEDLEKRHHEPGTVKSQQVLIIRELNRTTDFTCYANNSLDSAQKVITVIVTGPGSPPIIRGVVAERTNITLTWDPPEIINRPVTSYTIYYTDNSAQPIEDWQKLQVDEPHREVKITGLKPATEYFMRVRANDELGAGKLSGPVSATTRPPAQPPQVFLEQEELKVTPQTPFKLGCNVTGGDPPGVVSWRSRGRQISPPAVLSFLTLEHGGLIESTNFSCVAENEAGKAIKKIRVIVTGPTEPLRIRYAALVKISWDPPRVTNGKIVAYEVIYTDDPSLPAEQWTSVRTTDPEARHMTIEGLKESTEYTFRVRAINEYGPGLLSDAFKATTWIGKRSPQVLMSSDTLVRDPSMDELSVECEATGIPKPRIVWQWNNNSVANGEDGWQVSDITPSDATDQAKSKIIASHTTRSGTLVCQAVSDLGTDEKHIEVQINGPGSAPSHVAIGTLSNGLNVTWKAPAIPNGDIKTYIVYYTTDPAQDLGDWSKLAVTGNSHSTVIVPDEDDTHYYVRVQAATEDGPGIISEVVRSDYWQEKSR